MKLTPIFQDIPLEADFNHHPGFYQVLSLIPASSKSDEHNLADQKKRCPKSESSQEFLRGGAPFPLLSWLPKLG